MSYTSDLFETLDITINQPQNSRLYDLANKYKISLDFKPIGIVFVYLGNEINKMAIGV